jgi:type II secretory pathway component PulM
MIKKLLGSWKWELAGVICILLLIFMLFASCDARRQAQAERDLAKARVATAIETIEKIEDLKGRSSATDAQVQEIINEVRAADPKDRDAVARARLRELQQSS